MCLCVCVCVCVRVWGDVDVSVCVCVCVCVNTWMHVQINRFTCARHTIHNSNKSIHVSEQRHEITQFLTYTVLLCQIHTNHMNQYRGLSS